MEIDAKKKQNETFSTHLIIKSTTAFRNILCICHGIMISLNVRARATHSSPYARIEHQFLTLRNVFGADLNRINSKLEKYIHLTFFCRRIWSQFELKLLKFPFVRLRTMEENTELE